MTNQMPSPPSQNESYDEAIATIVALVALGIVFVVAVTRDGQGNRHHSTRSFPLAALGSDAAQDTDANGPFDQPWRLPFANRGKATPDGTHAKTDEGRKDDPGARGSDRPFLANPLDLLPAIHGGDRGLRVLPNPALNGGDDASPGTAMDVSPEQGMDTAGDADPGIQADVPPDVSSEVPSDLPSEASSGAESPLASEGSEAEVPELATETPTQPFPDVAPQYWATPFIEGLRQQEIVTGFVGGEFDPDSPISRAQFANQLDRAFAYTERSPLLTYNDVSADHPQYEAIMRVTQAGFMQGDDVGAFLPDNQVSRMEVLLALVSGLDLAPPADPIAVLKATYQDADTIPTWAVAKVATATELGMVVFQEKAVTFAPLKSATRAEAAAMVYQALVYAGEVPAVESEYIIRPQS